ncbi:erythromycin esterase family protein [Sphingobacterium sp. HSC-15S19]|uniref:erythromycin esterase family protein n=1 Tax=Sphingobacterium sp. HSC-15S19 TaxID=2910971 RepID=UPI003D194C1A
MTTKTVLFTFSLLIICVLIFYYYCRIENGDKISTERSRIINLSKDVTLVNQNLNEGFSFSDSVLIDKQIIILGEQQHGDGVTQQIYARLVMHLYNKGFKSLYLEAPLYRTLRFYQSLEHGAGLDFANAVYPFWSRAKETHDLRDFITSKATTNDPMYLGGLDFQIPTIFSQDKIREDLMLYLKGLNGYNSSDYKHFWFSLKNRFGPVLFFNSRTKEMESNRQKCLKELKGMSKLVLSQNNISLKDSIYHRYIENIYHFYYAKMYLKSLAYNNYRDSILFENFRWQMAFQKDRKAIVWIANEHASKENQARKTFGGFVKDFYKKRAYTILTTSIEGYTRNIASGNIQRVNPVTKNNLEFALKNKIDSIAFVIPPKNRAAEQMTMRFYGYHNLANNWFDKLDAFFLINKMKPNNY